MGPAGPQGPQGAQGPQGPQGVGAIPVNEEDAAMAAVSNVWIEIDGGVSFRPIAVSRLGFDVPVTRTGAGFLITGTPQHRPFTVMLGPDAPLQELAALWAEALDERPVRRDVEVTLQAGSPLRDAVTFTLASAFVSGFSDGTSSSAFVTFQPENFTILRRSVSPADYAAIDLPTVPGRGYQLPGQSVVLALHRVGGGEEQVSVERHAGGFYQPIRTGATNLSVTVVGRNALGTGMLNLLQFGATETWIEHASLGHPVEEDVQIHTLASGAIQSTRIHPGCVLTRVSFINPLLVNANLGLAPFVYDMTLAPGPGLP